MDITSQPVALLFAGQGNPIIGMGAELWNSSPATRRIWDCASDISGIDIRRVCLTGPMKKLTATPAQQLAVTAINLSLYTLLQEKAPAVVAVCGHSVGEYSALYAAGALALEPLFSLIHFRAAIMHQLSQIHKGAMLAVKGMDYYALRAAIARGELDLDISCDNSPRQQVVGGTAAALRAFVHRVPVTTTRLGVSGAWHTHLMQDGVQPMRDFLARVAIAPPRYPVVMNISAQPEYRPAAIRENLSLHLTHTVKWRESIDWLFARENPPLLIEIGHKVWLRPLLNDFPAFSPSRMTDCRHILRDR